MIVEKANFIKKELGTRSAWLFQIVSLKVRLDKDLSIYLSMCVCVCVFLCWKKVIIQSLTQN